MSRMPWRDSKVSGRQKKEMITGKVDQLPLVTSSENDSATPSGDSESKSDSSCSGPNKRGLHSDTCYVTTVTIDNGDSPTITRNADRKSIGGTSQWQSRLSLHSQQESPSRHLQTAPIISYEKNKSVRIIVKEPHSPSPSHSKRQSRPLDDVVENEVVNWRTSLVEKDRDVTNWVVSQHKPSSKHDLPTTLEKLKDEEGVKVRPLLETTWRSSSRTSVLDEPPSSDDCQRSTSTLVNTNTPKIGRSTSECQRGCIALLCGIAVVIGSAVSLRLPGLILVFGPGSFLCAFFACLLVVAVPLAYLECGLAQFSNNSVIGVWSLVPLARGIGWSTVVTSLYWGATTAGLTAPWFHYIVAENDPNILQVPDRCSFQNTTVFDAVTYYSSCVYNISSDWESGLDLTLTWTLPAGLITILMIASVSVAGGPVLFAFISVTGSVLAVIGYGIQLYIVFYELHLRKQNEFFRHLLPLLKGLAPDPKVLMRPQVWIAAASQALLCLGPGVGMLLNHSASNVFRHPLKRHLWTLTTITILATFIVTMTTVLELKIFGDYVTTTLGFETEYFDTVSETTTAQTDYNRSIGNESGPSFSYYTMEDSNCRFFSWSLSSFSCSDISPGLMNGVPFILSSHLTSTSMRGFPVWVSRMLTNLIFIGFLGAGAATSCMCMHVGVVAAREARSLPPAAAAIILMGVLSLVAAPMSTQAGASLIHLVDNDVLVPGVFWPSLATLIALSSCHGMTKIRKDLTFMLESVVSWVWLPVWSIILPSIFIALTAWAFVIDWRQMAVVDGPHWRIATVWGLRVGILISIPATAIVVVNSQLAYGFKDKILSSLQSSREWGDWGPQDPIEHHNWRRWREDETRSYASLERRLASKSRPLTYTHSTLSSSSSSTLARIRAKYKGQTHICDL